MSSSADQRQSRHQSQSRLPKFSTIAFFCAFVTLIAGLAWTVNARRTLSDEIADLHRLRVQLQDVSKQREADAAQSSRDREIILRVMQECRTGEDIPNLGGHRIVSRSSGGESISFYLPKGKHTLRVKTSWTTIPANQPKAEDTLSGEKEWTVELNPEHGYFFQMITDQSKEATLTWSLSANAETFQDITERVPIPPMRSMGGSWSRNDVTEFPNQIPIKTLMGPKTDLAESHSVRIGKWSKFGLVDGTNLKIVFDITVISVAPPVVSATDAQALSVLRKLDRIGEYLGEGRYGVKTD